MKVPSRNDLKAYIRVDGSGRDVAGSLVLRRKKPKNGKWREIQAYQCCDPDFSTTTTTTTSTTTTAPSDVRLKASIRLTGNKVGNLPEYTWKWNKVAVKLGLAHHRTTGVMAHEALVDYPDAVTMAEDGYMRVDYSKIV